MDCVRFELALIEQLEGTLDAADGEPMRAHAASCRACRELQAAAQGRASVVEPADLTSSILAATSGSSCRRAQFLSSERAVAALHEADEALELHLESGAECRTLGLVLELLRHELPLMAELEPDDDFVDEVMGLTTRLRQRRSPWERVARRPRLALEGAYAGTLALFLVVGFPGAPLAEVPARLLTGLAQRTEAQEAVVAGASQLVTEGRRAWTDSAQRLAASVDIAAYVDICEPRPRGHDSWSDIMQCWRRAGEERIVRSWRDHVEPVIESIDSLRRWVLALIDGGDPTREHNDGTIHTFL